MEFEKKLKKLSDYNVSFEIKNNFYHLSLIFDDNWDIMESSNEKIYIEKRNGVCHYIGSTNDVSIDDIFNEIDLTINYNIDLQKKLALFKQKTEELQDIFSKEPLDVLETITFTYGKEEQKAKKKPKKPKSTKKATKNEKIEETVSKIDTKVVNSPTDYNNKPFEEEEVVVMPEEGLEELEH